MTQPDTQRIAQVASLMGDPACTAMLIELMDGRSLTATELARAAHITPPAASRRLAMLTGGKLLAIGSSGRHHYYRLASPELAALVARIMPFAVDPSRAAPGLVPGPRDERLRTARSCYGHIAGRLGVAIADCLIEARAVRLDLAAGTGELTDLAAESLARFGLRIDDATGVRRTRARCRPCLDWSERRHHVSGRLGSAILAHCVASGWLRRRPSDRALDITPSGAAALRNWLGPARRRVVEQARAS